VVVVVVVVAAEETLASTECFNILGPTSHSVLLNSSETSSFQICLKLNNYDLYKNTDFII